MTAPIRRTTRGNTSTVFAAIVLLALLIGLWCVETTATSATSNPPPAATGSRSCAVDIRPLAIDRASAARVLPKVPAYTQGLIFADGRLYESTGQEGHSAIYRLIPEKGIRNELFALDPVLFGEGLAKLNNRFYQLTWRSGVAFAYEYDSAEQRLDRTQTFRRDGEGWGLTVLADELVLSDGSDRLSFIDPETFTTTRQLPVRLGQKPVFNLNELELVGRAILANVYGDSVIVAIDPASGCVTGAINAKRLVDEMATELASLSDPICTAHCSAWDFVLNGIAYDAKKDELYVTGKNWPLIFVYRGLMG
jgi:glutaminyl-peptide cyclotransferase